MGLRGAGGVKNFSVGICDGAPSTVRSSFIVGCQIGLVSKTNHLTAVAVIICKLSLEL